MIAGVSSTFLVQLDFMLSILSPPDSRFKSLSCTMFLICKLNSDLSNHPLYSDLLHFYILAYRGTSVNHPNSENKQCEQLLNSFTVLYQSY